VALLGELVELVECLTRDLEVVERARDGERIAAHVDVYAERFLNDFQVFIVGAANLAEGFGIVVGETGSVVNRHLTS
jgi:hypothetical protein